MSPEPELVIKGRRDEGGCWAYRPTRGMRDTLTLVGSARGRTCAAWKPSGPRQVPMHASAGTIDAWLRRGSVGPMADPSAFEEEFPNVTAGLFGSLRRELDTVAEERDRERTRADRAESRLAALVSAVNDLAHEANRA